MQRFKINVHCPSIIFTQVFTACIFIVFIVCMYVCIQPLGFYPYIYIYIYNLFIKIVYNRSDVFYFNCSWQ